MPIIALLRESPLQMRMPKEGNRRGHLLQRSPRIPHAQDVLVLIQRRAMRQCNLAEVLWLQWPLGHLAQPFQVLGGQLIMSPHSRGPRNRVESQRRSKAATHAVVIAPN